MSTAISFPVWETPETEYSEQNKLQNIYTALQLRRGIFLACLHRFRKNGGITMQTIGMKKTLNLHKYSIKLTEFSKSKKIIIPVAFSLAGLFLGSVSAKGEGVVCSQIINYFTNVLMDVNTNPVACFAEYLIIPTVFYAVSFFAGLSAFGALVANAVPLIFGFITGTISFFFTARTL